MAAGGEPDYALDERSKDGYVRVRVEIPSLKAKGKGMLSKITGGRKDQAKNAQIECDFQERSFTLTVTGDNSKGMDGKTWTLGSTKLPHPIDQFSSHWVTEDGFINVFLKKQVPRMTGHHTYAKDSWRHNQADIQNDNSEGRMLFCNI